MSETTTGAYETNTTLRAIADDLRTSARVVVTTHTKPDGDAIGSTVALVRALRDVGVDAVAVYMGFFPDRFAPFVREGEALFDPSESGEVFADERAIHAERVVICDTGARQQVKAALGFLDGRAPITTIVDHHTSGDADLAHARHIDTGASAACVSVAELCVALMGLESAAHLPLSVAEALYLGLGTDTGWFRYSNTDARTMRLAADLLEAGVDADALVRASECGDPPERLELLRRALNRTTLFADARAAMVSLRARDLEEAGVSKGDTGGLVDVARTVASVRVSVLLVEQGDGIVKVSMRSKGGEGSADVAHLAGTLGGGGHVHAAGARVEGDLEYAEKLIERLVTDALG